MRKVAEKSILKDEIKTINGLNYKECDIMSEDDMVLETIRVFEKNGTYDMQAALDNMGVLFGTSAWIFPE